MNWFFIKIFVRNLSRQRMFSFINMGGLAIGLTAVLLICAFIFNEFSFDNQFTHHKRIYRANSELTIPGLEGTASVTSGALALAALEEIPGIETAVRVRQYPNPLTVQVGEVPFKVERFCFADDEDFFLLFDIPVIYGSAEEVFAQSGGMTIAISESLSKIFFGDMNPIGETLLSDGQLIEVKAVYKDFPANSSFNHQMIGHFKPQIDPNPRWTNIGSEVYFLLAQNADAAVVEAAMQQLLHKNTENPVYQIRLQPLNKIHLYSKDFVLPQMSLTANHGDIGQVKLFSLLAVILLLVACINYMNLSTARAQKRSKEIGMSKTLGAKRKGIIARLYIETGLLTLIAFMIAFLLAAVLMPFFNTISGQNMNPDILLNAKFLLGMLLVYLITTFISASYPALYLSGFAPLTIIRQAAFTKGSSHAMVRKGLSVLQFSAAVILIAYVLIIHTQLRYMNNRDKGFNVEQVIGVPLPSQTGLDALRNDYLAQAEVSAVSFTSGFPFSTGSGRPLAKTLADMDGENSNVLTMFVTKTTPEAIDMLQFRLIAGTTLPETKPDSITNIIINRKAVEFMETTPEEIIGKMLPIRFNTPVYVVGVVENFHFQSLHEPVAPYGYHDWTNQGFTHLMLKVEAGNISQEMLRTYEEIFKRHFPNHVFDAQFPDTILANAYKNDRQTGSVVLSFSILAILIACMGVFGLTAFMAEQRTKEIGIRKVLGASAGSIVRLFTDSYLRLLALSLVIAIPIAFWIGSRYLEGFAYRISLSGWIFVIAALITTALTLLTVCVLALQSAMANPVEAIKTE